MIKVKSKNLKFSDKRIAITPEDCIQIFTNEVDPREVQTIPEVFYKICQNFHNHTALVYKEKEEKNWISITYGEYKIRVEKIAKAFIKLGLKEHETVTVFAANSVEWFLSFLAAIHAGGQITGIYTTSSANACQFILENSKTKILVVDNDERLSKILKIKEKLPNLKVIIQTFPSTLNSEEKIFKWHEIEEMKTEDVDAEYSKRLENISANYCCSINYTSGTTGNPKGAMLSHDNIIWNVKNFINTLGSLQMGEEIMISYLPMSHVGGSYFELILPILTAAAVYFADENALKDSLFETLVDVRPTFFLSVPRVYEKIINRFTTLMNENNKIQNHLIKWAQNVSLNFHLNESGNSFKYFISKQILKQIKAALGLDRIKNLFIGTAPSNIENIKTFFSLDLKLLDLYGLTETFAIICSNFPHQMKLESVGKTLPDVGVKIINADETGCGEICFRGRMTFMGYLNNMEKTLEVIDKDGWFHSGDIGYIDEDGFVFITGRSKEVIKTSGGKMVPYIYIENLVKNECQAISNAFLVGDKQKYLTILITLKTTFDSNGKPCDELAFESLMLMKNLGLNYTLLSEILNAGPDRKVINAIQAAIERANEKVNSNPEKIKKFAILPNDFSVETFELNITLKLRRHFVLEKYKDIIENFYKT